MTKKEARKMYREKREALSHPQIEKLQDLLLIQFQHLDLPFLEYVHTYLPADGKKEVDTFMLIKFLEFKNPGLNVVIPKTDAETVALINYRYTEETILHKNQYGILEPESGDLVDAALIDLVFVPLLAFDLSGHRAGYGKGYYDRFLTTCRPDAIKIGLSFFEEVDIIEDTGTFDIRLDYCVTPHKLYEF